MLPLLVLLCMSPALRAAEPQVVFEDKFDTKLGDGWAWLRENPKAWRITAAGKEWPQWCGSDGKNMASDEKGLADTFVPGKKDPQGKGLDLTTARNVKWAVEKAKQGF